MLLTLTTTYKPATDLGYLLHKNPYRCQATSLFPEWGSSAYYTLELSKETTVAELLKHLYVLIPVLDNQKHYYIDASEINKLLKHGEGWLESHPEKENIPFHVLATEGRVHVDKDHEWHIEHHCRDLR